MEEEKEKGIEQPTFPDPTPIALENIPFSSVGDVLMVYFLIYQTLFK